MAATKTYRVVIETELGSGQLKSGQRDVDAYFSRMEKRAVEAARKVEEAMKRAGGALPGSGAPGSGGGRGSGGLGGVADQHVKAFRAMEREAARAAREVERINTQTTRQATQQAKIQERADRTLADARIRESKRVANDFLRTQKEMTAAAAKEEAARAEGAARTRRLLGTAAAVAGAAVLLGAREVKRYLDDSVVAAAELRRQVANIKSIKPEINTDQVFAALNEMQRRVPQTAEQLAEALYDVFSSINVTQAEGLQLVEKFARGATAALTDAKTFGTAVVGVMNAYGKSVQDVDHIQDVFFNTVKNGVVTGQELASNLGLVTQAAKNAGVDFDVLGSLIAGVTKEGGPAAQNINNLANTLQKFPVAQTQKALRALKVETIDLSTGGFRPMIDVLSDLKEKLDKLPPAVRAAKLQEIFPDVQARTGLQTLLSQLDFIKTALDENRTASGAAGAAYQTMAQTYAVASALQDNSLRSFQQTVGDTIIQNAAWVKATEITTQQINGQTDALKTAGSQTQIFANDFTIAISKIKAQMIPFVGFVVKAVSAVGGALGTIMTAVVGAILRFVEDTARGVQGLVVLALNSVIRLINGVESILEKAGLKGVIGVGGQIEYFKEPERPNFGSDFFFNETKKAFDQMVEAGKSMKSLADEGRAAREAIDQAVEAQRQARRQTSTGFGELRRIEADADAATARTREAERLAQEQLNRPKPGGGAGVYDAMTEGKDSRRKSQKIIDDAEDFRISEIREIQEWFRAKTGRTLPVRIGQSDFHNRKGWDHRNAADIQVHPNSPEGRLLTQYFDAQGYPYRAFTGAQRNSRGELIATGPHIHLGEPSRAFGKNVRSRAITRTRDEDAFLVFDAAGRPVAPSALASGQLPEGAQVRRYGSEQQYGMQRRVQAMMAAGRNAPVDAAVSDASLLGDTSRLGVEETRSQRKFREYNENLIRQEQELADKRVFLAEYVEGRRREVAAEYFERETQMAIDLGGKDQELAELRRQSADDQLTQQRRLLKARSEEVDLTLRIRDAEDELANGPYNATLRVQAALLEDLISLRRRDEEAVIAQNRAQLELADSTTYHAEQANAKVLEYLASQRSVTDVIADAKIGVIESTFDLIDRGLDRMTSKLGAIGGVVRDLISGFIRLALNRAFQSMMLPSAGGRQQGGDGVGLDSFLTRLFNPAAAGGAGGASYLTGGFAGGASPAAGISVPASGTSQTAALRQMAGFIPGMGDAAATAGAASGAGAPGFGAMLAGGLPALAIAYGLASWQGAMQGKLGDFQAATGGGVLGFFVNRTIRRRKEEKIREQVTTQLGSGVWALIDQVRSDQIDGLSAIQQASQMEQEYLQQVSQLKDSKTRKHAELWYRNDYPQIRQTLKRVADDQAQRRTKFEAFIPTFADGGFNGRVPGVYDRRDSKLIAVSGNEVILTPGQWQPIAPYLAAAGVPGLDGGVGSGGQSKAQLSASVTIHPDGLATVVVKSPLFGEAVAEVAVEAVTSNIGRRGEVFQAGQREQARRA